MAWDTEATRQKLLGAGVRQFAAFGLAGARMETIGKDAGVNKERVYRYFGNKESFFAAVLSRELGALLDDLLVNDRSAEGVGDFAGRMFDRCHERPELPRLLAWESLELDEPVAIRHRREGCASTAQNLQWALDGITQGEAERLLFSVIALTVSSQTLPRVADSVLSRSASTGCHREMVVRNATLLAHGWKVDPSRRCSSPQN